MCSILIFIKPDNEHPDPAQDWKKFKAGDVIDIAAKDKHDWGRSIIGPQALGWWRVVVVRGAAATRFSVMLESGPMPYAIVYPDPAEDRHLKRKFSVDILQLKDTMTEAEFMAAISAKPETIDYRYIHPANKELG